MIHRMFAVFDVTANAYLQPFFTVNTGTAVRSISELVNDKAHQFGKYPNDYVLYEVGSFNDADGLLSSHQAPVKVAVLVDFIRE